MSVEYNEITKIGAVGWRRRRCQSRLLAVQPELPCLRDDPRYGESAVLVRADHGRVEPHDGQCV